MPVTFPRVPDKADAKYLAFTGVRKDDPVDFAVNPTTDIDAKFLLKPIQDEILNLNWLSGLGSQSLPVRNQTGATLAKGTLVCAGGWSTTEGRVLLMKAALDSPIYAAQFVLSADLPNNANGLAWSFALVSGLDTSHCSVGAFVYLGATAGTWGFSQIAGAGLQSQEVGVVAVANETTGAILFFPGAGRITLNGSASLQDGAVTGQKLTALAARVYSAATLSLPDSVLTALAFDTVRYDNGAMWNGAHPTRLRGVFAGKYRIGGHGIFASSAACQRSLYLRVNGATIIAGQDSTRGATATQVNLSLTTEYALAANDYVELLAYQTSGSALVVTPEFWMSYAGA